MSVPESLVRTASDRLAIEQGCYFDESAARRVIDFIETKLFHYQGEFAGRPFRLLPWQSDLVTRVFGWKRLDGRRRFRSLHLDVAKKNGASTLLRALALALMRDDDEKEPPQVRLQAALGGLAEIQYREVGRMIGSSDLKHSIRGAKSRGVFRDDVFGGTLHADSTKVEFLAGVRPSATILDDAQCLRDEAILDHVHACACGRDHIVISRGAAGLDPDGYWRRWREYGENVEAGLFLDIGHLGIIHRASPDDDVSDPAVWRKANPSLGVTIQESFLAEQFERAKSRLGELALFKRFHLNMSPSDRPRTSLS